MADYGSGRCGGPWITVGPDHGSWHIRQQPSDRTRNVSASVEVANNFPGMPRVMLKLSE
jgi:hypothetical protein